MRSLFVLLPLAISLSGCANAQPKGDAMSLTASDGKTFFARLYRAPGKAKGVILMFHQAGSNMEEYTPIAPRVAKLGFDCLTVDQRSGGNMWNAQNRTAAQYDSKPGYLDAYRDLEGALKWAEKNYDKRIVWGSSYSAALSLKLASEHPEVDGLLLFSPGEYFDETSLVGSWNQKVKVPALFSWTQDEAGQYARTLYLAKPDIPARKKDVLAVGENGVHGSSTLRSDRNPKGNGYYWAQVEKFLANFLR